ncbi:NADPH-dependent ferric siderophore reductase [Catenuloplanes atrovinosus]|uniref:NADPH-dependent ferric siderophore reductase n=2 Tax=Catenuloplanes atrovinosus TaxID=137266 RepID=A0AAE4CBI7_9ACTN|nr:NADPH-dependent ferric siderophore reductase [Catenuloplanes atrovinosus]
MTRMVVTGPAIAHVTPGPFTDTYVRLVIPRPGVTLPENLDLRRMHAELPRSAWPRIRTYTVRSLDPAAAELAIDIYDHGRAGLTRSWLSGLRIGDPVLMGDLRGLYRPGPEADWHLLAGDAVALPAIAVTLAAMTPGTRAKAVIEVADAADEQPLPTAADCAVRWVHRSRGESLVEAVRALPFDPGVVQAFVHGEGGAMRELRRFLLRERGMRKELLSISGYWRRGLTDEQWRRAKAMSAER